MATKLQEENTALKEEKEKLKATMLEDVEKQMTCQLQYKDEEIQQRDDKIEQLKKRMEELTQQLKISEEKRGIMREKTFQDSSF